MSSLSSLSGSNSLSSTSSSSSSLTGLNTSGIQFSGLASGLDTNKIIQGLLAIDQAKITQLTNNQQKITQKQTAFKAIEARLLSLQTNSDRLARTFNGVLETRIATSNNTDLVTASAASGAPPGVYSFRANTLAQAAQVASQGFASATSAITQGTFQFRVGSGATSTITVGSTNNTLQGLADAINNLAGDVSATVVNDGSSGQPYHILLAAKKSGAANAITITNGLGPDAGGAVNPTFATVVQAASDASITLGSGTGGFTITSPTNQIEGVFNGVTLNLQGADSTKTITVKVASDTDTAKKAVEDFVHSFNDLIDSINQGSTYDKETGAAGVFLGNHDASQIANSLTNSLSNVVAGLGTQVNRLSAIGITLNDHGKLSIDDNKLTQAISGQLSGVSSRDVSRLFALTGQSSNSGVQFIFAGDKTKTGDAVQVDITQAATQANLTATTALAASITIDSSNNTFGLTVDGRPATVTLAGGVYTPQTLTSELQAELDGNASLAGSKIQVGLDTTNHLSLTSKSYGTNSSFTVTAGSALGALGFAVGANAIGQIVAGSFIVNGVTESGQGNGQILSGLSTNSSTSGLQVRVTLGATQVTAGPEASLTVTRGVASRLGQVLSSFLNPINGRLKNIDETFQSNVDSIQHSIDIQKAAIKARQNSLLLQFSALEATIAQLQSVGNFLTSQFTSTKTTK